MRGLIVCGLTVVFGCGLENEQGQRPAKPIAEPESGSHVAPCSEPRLRIDMLFTADTDLDLHVLTPNGNEIYFANTSDDGGLLDEDLCISSCGPGQHGEAVFFCSTVYPGDYQVWVENYDGRARANFQLQADGEASATAIGFLANESGAASAPMTFTVGTP